MDDLNWQQTHNHLTIKKLTKNGPPRLWEGFPNPPATASLIFCKNQGAKH